MGRVLARPGRRGVKEIDNGKSQARPHHPHIFAIAKTWGEEVSVKSGLAHPDPSPPHSLILA